MSILMDFDPSDEDNNHFQKAIDQWQILYDENQSRCNVPQTGQKRGMLDDSYAAESHPSLSGISNNSTAKLHDDTHKIIPLDNSSHRHDLKSFSTNQTFNRLLRDDSPYGRGGWDPFHPSLERVSAITNYSSSFFPFHNIIPSHIHHIANCTILERWHLSLLSFLSL
jgi:hypothetical protein